MTHKLNRFTALMLAVIMTFSVLLVPVEASSFRDVTDSSWYAEAVEYVHEKGFMAGVSENSFAPGADVTRGMMVTVLARYAGAETDNDVAAFTDTTAGRWYTGAAAWAAENGIVKGVSNGYFAPNRAITRQDLCVMLYAFIQARGIELENTIDRTFADMDSVAEYARSAVIYCTGVGLISGYEDSCFRPKDTATRAQLAQILMRLDLLIKGEQAPTDPMPAQSFDGEAGEDMSISVNAPEGALPEGTNMTVSRITGEDALAAIKDKVGTDVYAAADITFSKDGAKLEPEANVEVQIELDGLDDIENPAVAHIKDDGTVEYVASEVVYVNRGSGKALRFYARDFSVYAVVVDPGQGTYTVNVEFYARQNVDGKPTGEWELINKQIVLSTMLGEGKTPVTDPGVPTMQTDWSFEGWFEATSNPASAFTDDDADDGQTVAEINATVNSTTTADCTLVEGNMVRTLKYYALLYKVVYITYHDQAGNVLETESNHITGSGSTLTKVFDKTYIPYKGDQKFFGWTPVSNVAKDSNNALILGDYPEYVSTDASAYYKVDGSESTVTYPEGENDLHVYPFLARGYWLIFDNNISANNTANSFTDATSASYTAPVLYRAGENTVKPANPTRTGYKFDDGTANAQWYSDPGMTRPFTFGQPLTADTTVYAKWTPDTADYYVVYWKQQATDGVNAAEKHYDYVDRVKKTATTGTPVSLSSSDTVYNVAANTEDPYYFEYSAADSTTGSVQVKGDGTTVLNVRYNRKTITFRFGPATAKYYVESSPDWSKHYVYYVKSGSTYLECRRVSTSSGSYVYFTEYTGSMSTSGTYYMLMDNTFCQLVYDSGWYIYYDGDYYYTSASDNGKVYTRSTSAPSTLYYQKYELTSATTTLRGLYGHQLDTNDWPAASSGKCWNNFDESDKTVYEYPMPLLEFVPTWQEGTTLRQDFYEQDYSTSVIKVYYYGASLSNTSYYSVKLNEGTTTKGGKWYPNESVQGFTIKGYRFASSLPAANSTWTSCTSTSAISVDASETRNLYFAFDRNQYNLVFSSTTAQGTANDTVSVYYDAPLSSFKDRQPTNSNPGYYFDGWYADANCETPFVFSGNMPARNVMVYAKWTKIRFRVVLDYNANGEDITFPGNQADSFRLDYGEQVEESAIMAAERPGYVLLGWYYTGSDGKEHDFNFAMGANDEMADMSYGTKQDDETQAQFEARMNSDARTGAYQVVPNTTGNTTWDDKWTTANPTRKNVRGKITIYAKWRENPDGLTGVNVKYFANHNNTDTGYFPQYSNLREWDDPYIYTNLAEAYAQSASRPDNTNERFVYWELLDENGNVVKTVYPGQTFTVNTDDAHYTHVLKDQYFTCTHENAVLMEAVAPTCTTAGNVAYWYCSDCERYYLDVFDGETHSIGARTTQSAVILPAAHTPDNIWHYNNDGTGHWQECSVCGAHLNGAAHNMVKDDAQSVDPSPTATGLLVKVCSVCGYTTRETLPVVTNVTVTYHVPACVTAIAPVTVQGNTSVTLPTAQAPAGYTFQGWVRATLNETTSQPSEILTGSLTVNVNTDLYALYIKGSTEVTYQLTETLENNGKYILVADKSISGTTGYAVGNSLISAANTYLTPVEVTINSDNTCTTSDSESVLWLAQGSDSNGWSFKNNNVGKYMGVNSGNDYNLELLNTRFTWAYTSDKYLDNQVDPEQFYYLSYATASTSKPYDRYTTGKISTGTYNYVIHLYKEKKPVYTTEIASYTVSFEVPSGVAAVSPVSCIVGGSVTLPTAGAPSNYTFAGWVTATVDNETTAPTILNGSYTPADSITLKALYSYTADGGKEYNLLTSAPSDWTGNYVITGKQTADTDINKYVMPGLNSGTSYESSSVSNRIVLFADSGINYDSTNNRLTNVDPLYVFSVESYSTGYSVKNTSTNTYLYSESGGTLYAKSTLGSDCVWTLSFSSPGVVMRNTTDSTWQYVSLLQKQDDSTVKFFGLYNSSSTVYWWKETTTGTTYYTTEISGSGSGETDSYNVKYYVNGTQVGSTQSVEDGSSVTVGSGVTVTAPSDMTFTGYWVTAEGTNIDYATVTKYAHGTDSYTVNGADVNFYALFSQATGGTSSTKWTKATAVPAAGTEFIIAYGTSAMQNAARESSTTALPSTSFTTENGCIVTSDDSASGLAVSGHTFVLVNDGTGTLIKSTVSTSTMYIHFNYRSSSRRIAIAENKSNSYVDVAASGNGFTVIGNAAANSWTSNTIRCLSTTFTNSATAGVLDFYVQTTVQSGGTTTYTTGTAVGGNAVEEPETVAEEVVEPEQTRGLNPGQPVTVSNTVWVPYNESTIDTTKEYLIGVVYNGNTYLMLNYNPAQTNHYYEEFAFDYTSSGTTYTSSYKSYIGYTGTATFSDSNITGMTGDTTDMQYAGWKFVTTTNGYNIVSAYESNRYVYANISSTNHFWDMYPIRGSSSASVWTWDYENHALKVYNSNIYAAAWQTSATSAYYMTPDASSGEHTYVQLYVKQTDHTLTVNFTGPSDGTFVAPTTHTEQVVEGVQYSYTVPTVPGGYTPTVSVVTGTMGTNDVTVTVEYTKAVESNERWEPTTQIVPGEDYLIAYVINGTPYLIVNHSEVNNADYYTITSDGTDYNMAYLAPAGLITENGIEYVKSVSGATTSLDNCHWIFSSSTGGTITSGYDSTKTLYWSGSTSNIAGVYPYTVADTWTWTPNGSGNMGSMKTTWTSTGGTTYTMYFYPRTASGAASPTATPPYAGMSRTSFTNIRLYHRVATTETTWKVRFYDEDGDAIEGIDDQTVKNGKYAAEPTAPEKTDYYFLGWFKKGETTAFDFDNTAITADTDLVAKYDYMYIDTYTVWLRAVYGIPNVTGKTHIYWYANDGTDAGHGVGAGDRYEMLEINMNSNQPIPTPISSTPISWYGGTNSDTPTQTGLTANDRIFLGWARLDSTSDTGVYHPELNEENLYLKWVVDDSETGAGHYEYKPSIDNLTSEDIQDPDSWHRVTDIYADESQPYHDMYAVWASYAYVVHSSSGKMEAVRVNYVKGEKQSLDLVAKVPSNCLYGGYYRTYGGTTVENVASVKTAAMNAAFAEPNTVHLEAVPQAKTYDGSKIKPVGGSTRFWTKNDAYQVSDRMTDEEKADVNGRTMKPEIGEVYYLKEVPQQYLTTKYVYTYDTQHDNVIKNFFMLTVVDDSYYKEIGFLTKDGATTEADAATGTFKPRKTLSSYFTISESNHPESDITVNAASFGLTSGYVGILQDDASITEDASFSLMPKWTTLDGVGVNSRGGLQLTVNSYKTAITYKALTGSTVSTPLTTFYVQLDSTFKNDYLKINDERDDFVATWLYFFNGSNNRWVKTTAVEGTDNSLWKADFPSGEWEAVIVVRGNPDEEPAFGAGISWNQTADLHPTGGNFTNRSGFNLVTLSGWDNGYGQLISSIGLYGATP